MQSIKKKTRKNSLLYVGIIVLSTLLLKMFVLETYLVSQNSMNHTLEDGDKVLISRLASVRRGSIVVINKNQKSYIKRCVGMPGDEIVITNGTVFINDSIWNYPSSIINFQTNKVAMVVGDRAKFDINIYGHYNRYWTLSDFGPVLVPYKGLKLRIDTSNEALYKGIIAEEISNSKGGNTRDDEAVYTFRNDYYFLLGDNWPMSEDSRSFGVVKKSNVVGVAKLLLFSKNDFWNRGFFKRLN